MFVLEFFKRITQAAHIILIFVLLLGIRIRLVGEEVEE
jgi:hypothetical protein